MYINFRSSALDFEVYGSFLFWSNNNKHWPDKIYLNPTNLSHLEPDWHFASLTIEFTSFCIRRRITNCESNQSNTLTVFTSRISIFKDILSCHENFNSLNLTNPPWYKCISLIGNVKIASLKISQLLILLSNFNINGYTILKYIYKSWIVICTEFSYKRL